MIGFLTHLQRHKHYQPWQNSYISDPPWGGGNVWYKLQYLVKSAISLSIQITPLNYAGYSFKKHLSFTVQALPEMK